MVVWQIPVMLLNFSILLFVFGLLALLRAKAIQAGGQLSHDDVKVRISDFSWPTLTLNDRSPSLLDRSLSLHSSAICLGCFCFTIRSSKMRHDCLCTVSDEND